MKFTVEHAAIKKALATAMLAVPSRVMHIPILSCVLLKATDTGLRISGSCLDIEAHGKCEAVVAVPGEAAVDAALLSALIGSCPVGSLVEFWLDDLTLHVSAGRIKASFASLDAFNFPHMTPPDATNEVEGWAGALTFCADFCGHGDIRHYLNGVTFEAGAAVSGDGARLGSLPVTYSGPRIIIPVEAIPAIMKAAGENGRLFLGTTAWRVEAENTALAGKIIDGDFTPGWRKLLPGEDQTWLSCEADALLDAVKAAGLGQAREILLRVTGPDLVVIGERFDGPVSGCATAIPCDGVDGRAICFSTKLLTATLTALKGRVISFAGDKPAMPQRITAAAFNAITALSPMRHPATEQRQDAA